MANIYICCDGTWQSADDEEDGIPVPSNVSRIANAVATHDIDGVPQRRYYHSGVGAEGSQIARLLGGGAGLGLSKNIKSPYKWLATTYEEGDKIFLFGFSRGAYTVRSLAGMIAACGLIDLRHKSLNQSTIWDRVDEVFDNYRKSPDERRQFPKYNFFNTSKGGDPFKRTSIHFLGVWDTVGALGIPDHMALLNLFDRPDLHEFHDTDLSDAVVHARHAVAIDEMRAAFTPTLWTNHGIKTDMKQTWFPGVHGDVGGGYPETGLSDIALKWMIDEATQCGLVFDAKRTAQIAPDPHGIQHDSLTSVFKALETRPRNVPCINDERSDDFFHASAIDRYQNPPITRSSYWPSIRLEVGDEHQVDIFAREVWNSTWIFMRDGETYELNADGEWVDSSVECGPSGTNDDNFQIGELAQMAASAVGQIEKLFKTISNNTAADFWYTKREEDAPWFALMGVVANGQGTSKNGNPRPHQSFLIGEEMTLQPSGNGYLYCFANDAWRTYDNNRGSVVLTVKRTQ